MSNLEYHLSEIRHCRHRVAENSLHLKAMRLARPNTYLPSQIRQAEYCLDFYKSRLRLMEHVFQKYHPDQPRVPAGNSDGGQWTDGGGSRTGNAGRWSGSIDPVTTGAVTPRNRRNDLIAPAAYSGQGQHSNLEFNESQKAELTRKIGSGKGAYVEAYKYLRQQVQNQLKNPRLSAGERNELEAQEFWLRKAGEINGDDPSSQGNFFIRSVTRNVLRFDEEPADLLKIQANSNLIGENVMKDVLKNGRIPSIEQIIAYDAYSAIEKGGQTIGGWGGAFNYWDSPLPKNPKSTVGNDIQSDPAEYEKFISVNANALADTVRKFRSDRYPDNTTEAIFQGLNAQVPARIKSEIISRAFDGINGERGGFAGDPYNIDGYHPHFNDDDKVIGWYFRDKRLKQIDVTDRQKINELNTRYAIRQSKGEFHPWQH